MDVVYERCAGIDISKADVKVCIRVPGRGRGTRRRGEVRTFPAMTSGLLATRATRRLVSQLNRLGYQVNLHPVEAT